MHTRSSILVFSEDSAAAAAFSDVPQELKEEVLGRLGTLIKNVAPVFLLCESRDIGISERLKDDYTNNPSLYVFDMYPGGTGLSEGFLSKGSVIYDACLDLVENCPCEAGCPSCIGPDAQENPELDNRKTAIQDFLRSLLEHRNSEPDSTVLEMR